MHKIPYITGIEWSSLENHDGKKIIIDAYNGVVILDPTEDELNAAIELLSQQNIEASETENITPENLLLNANVNDEFDMNKAASVNANGVGLLRTEHFLISKKRVPTEEEQFHFYASLTRSMPQKKIAIHLFDLGSDKQPLSHRSFDEPNPALGKRGIRFLLANPTILESQISAIVRVSRMVTVSIIVPMVVDLTELQAVIKLVRYFERKHNVTKKIAIGIMVEVPAVVWSLESFKGYADFFTLGTNDLLQYTLAADRLHLGLSKSFTASNPSFIRAINHVIGISNKLSIPLSVCGEMASIEKYFLLLYAMGMRQFSMSPMLIPHIRRSFPKLASINTKEIVEDVLKATTQTQVDHLLDHLFDHVVIN